MLARNEGVLENVRSTEPIEFKTRAFVSKIGARPLDKLQMTVEPPANIELVYPLDPVSFAGSVASWVGRYTQPGGSATFTARGMRDHRAVEMRATAPLPVASLEHVGLPRTSSPARPKVSSWYRIAIFVIPRSVVRCSIQASVSW